MNPGDAATLNDENLNLIFEPRVVAAYEERLSDVLHHRRSENHWDPESSVNVLFTPCRTGVRPIEKLFEWIDAENEFIMISVFDLTNLVSPGDRRTLVDHLADAKARGAEVVIITDRKKSDGRDAEGNRVMMYGFYASNDMIDEMLEDAGLPVYEFVNETGEFNAMHPRSAVFGLSNIKVMTMSSGDRGGDRTIELPFGALVKFKVFTREGGGTETLREELVEAIAIPTSDRPEFPRFPEIVGAPTLATTITTTTAPTVTTTTAPTVTTTTAPTVTATSAPTVTTTTAPTVTTTTAPTVSATATPAPPMRIHASDARSEDPRRRP